MSEFVDHLVSCMPFNQVDIIKCNVMVAANGEYETSGRFSSVNC